MKAKFIKKLSGFTGDARLYELTKPIQFTDWPTTEEEEEDGFVSEDGFVHRTTSFVVVSGTVVAGKPETYIFPSDSEGDILNWTELDGSFRGSIDHARALKRAGFSLINEF